ASGMILLEGGQGDSMIVIPATGGAPRPASHFDRRRGDLNHASPRFLPDGKHFLYMAYRQVRSQISMAIMLGRLGSLEAQGLGPCDGDVDFPPPNHVLYITGPSLAPQPLDSGGGVLPGAPATLAEGLPPQSPLLFSAGGN